MPSPFRRYAIYHVPGADFGAFGASWLGWDCVSGQPIANPATSDWTVGARRYGFHATLKAPFRLAEGTTETQLLDGLASLAQRTAPISLAGLEPQWMGRFLALVPSIQSAQLQSFAAQVVKEMDQFRMLTAEADQAKYANRNLSPQQQENLANWGYPYVLDTFRCHLTLTDRVSKDARRAVNDALREALGDMPRPYVIDHVSVVGEGQDGMFYQIGRYALGAPPVGSDR